MKVKRKKLSGIILFLIVKNIIIVWTLSVLLSALTRFLGTDNAFINLEEENRIFIYTLIMATIHAIVIFLLFRKSIDKVVTKRIRELNAAANKVIDGNLDLEVDVKGTDELSNLTDSFNKMVKGLQSNEYLNKEFIRNTSHEFKTPLSTIRAYGELIEGEVNNENGSTENIKDYTRIIVDETDRLTSLTKSILQISLLDGAMSIKKDDEFSLDEQIKQILTIRHPKYSEKNINFDLNLEKLNITSNKTLLYQVWQNLIDNAIKFSEDNSTIFITLSKVDEKYCFEITDTGLGIKKEDKEKIFHQFYMSDKSRTMGGSGLGLSIVKKILTKLDGSITFESDEKKGTTFKIFINA